MFYAPRPLYTQKAKRQKLATSAMNSSGEPSQKLPVPHLAGRCGTRALAPMLGYPVIATSGLAAGIVVCVAPSALAVVGNGDPIRVEVSTEATVHFEDTTPLALSATATPNTVAAPALSAFQMDLTVIRMLAPITWAMRTTGAVSWVSSVTW